MGATSSEVKRRYNKKTYDRIEASIKKGLKAEFKALCEENGTTANAEIGKFIEEYINKYK